MAWFYVMCADLFEIAWLFLVKWANVHISPVWGAFLATAVVATPAAFLLNAAMKTLPAGTVYTVFIGVAAVGTALAGIVFFNESTSLPRLASMALIILGIFGLKYFTAP